METIMGIVGWFTNGENIQNIFAVIGAFFALAFAVVKLTPTKADDEFVQKVYDFVHGFLSKLGMKK
jgi:hypothetical protein